jgi:heat shock protein HslJ
MLLRLIGFASLGLLLTACATTEKNMTTSADLIDKQWRLISVDEQAVARVTGKFPQLAFDSTLKATGVAGCNNFFGQTQWQEGQLRINNMGMTMMMCQAPLDAIELDVAATLSDWSSVTITQDTLTLTGSEHTLVYELIK